MTTQLASPRQADHEHEDEAGDRESHLLGRRVLVCGGQQVGGADEEEKAHVEREQVAEVVLGDAEQGAHCCADERGERVGGEPAQRLAAVVRLPEHEGDRVEAIGEVVGDNRQEDE